MTVAPIAKITDEQGKIISKITPGNKVRIYFISIGKTYRYLARIAIEGKSYKDGSYVTNPSSNSPYVTSVAIPSSWLGSKSSVTLSVQLVTQSSAGETLGVAYKDITLVANEFETPSATPSVNGPTIEYVSAGNSTIDSWNQSSADPIFVQGLSKAKITFTGQISSCARMVPSIPNLSDASTTSSSIVYSTSTLTSSGAQSAYVDFYYSTGGQERKSFSFYVYSYSPPLISYVETTRCDSNGNYDPKGTRLKCTYSVNVSSIGGRNGLNSNKSRIVYREKNTSSWYHSTYISSTDGVVVLPQYIDSTKVYEVQVEAYDILGGSVFDSASATTAERMLNFAPYGNGLAIGQVSTVKTREESGKFEVGWDTEFGANVTFDSVVEFNQGINFSSSITTNGLRVNGDCDIDTIKNLGGATIFDGGSSTLTIGDSQYISEINLVTTANGKVKVNGTELSSGGATTTSELEPTFTYANEQGMGKGAPLIKFKGQDDRLKTAATVQYVQNYVDNSVTGSHTHSTSQINATYRSDNNYLIDFKNIDSKGNNYCAVTPAWIKSGEVLLSNFKADLVAATGKYGKGNNIIKFFKIDSGPDTGATTGYVQGYCQNYTTENCATKDHNHSGTYSPVGHTHNDYAPSSHTHNDYAPSSHTHNSKNIICSTRDSEVAKSDIIQFSNVNGTTPTYVQKYVKSNTGSDIRLKNNITLSTTNSLDVINHMMIKEFDWVNGMRAGCHWDVGVIADELEKLDTRFVSASNAEEENQSQIEYKSVDTWYLTGHILKAIQQLSEKIDQLESKISNM